MENSTKLQRLLIQRGLSQSDLQKKVQAKTGIKIEPYRVSKIVNGSIIYSTVYHGLDMLVDKFKFEKGNCS